MDHESGGSVDPRRAYSVEVSGVGGPRNRSGLAAAVALVAVVALVVGGLVSGQLFPSQQAAVAPSAAPSAVASVASAAPTPAPTPLAVPTGPLTARTTASPVDVVALIASIPKHGTGPLAFVSGRLSTKPRPCEQGAPLSECLTIRIDGLRGASVVPDDTITVWPGDPVPNETLVLLPRDGKLVFLGALVVDPAGIPRIDVLQARLGAAPVHAQAALYEADGVLVRDVVPCLAAVACDTGDPALLPTPPDGRGPLDFTGAVPVRTADGAFGVAPSAAWTTGPFLVRYTPSDAMPWRLVAREDQGSILHVVIP